jgi:putative spermidine/putrescine transport system permease protein
LTRLDPAYEEASQSLGASNWTTFREVTFPAIRPGILVGAFYAFAISFGDVPISVFLVNERTMTLPVEIFNDMQVDFQPHILALSTLLIVLSLAMMFAIQKIAGLDFMLSARKSR